MRISEQKVLRDKSTTDDIVKSFEDEGHYRWFKVVDPNITDKYPAAYLEMALKYGLGQLTKMYGYDLKRVVIKDKGKIVGFLIWTNKGSDVDDIGDNKIYPVILSTAIHPDYRNRGLLRMMLNKSGIEKPYLVQTSSLSPIGLWEKMGCKIVKKMELGNNIEKCD